VLAAVGLLLGLAAAFPLSRLVLGLLFEVGPSDFWSLATPFACLLAATALAALPAALRAVRVDPVVALRYE
jgi:ABC-type antimicrobial peptide transport system permease subunit